MTLYTIGYRRWKTKQRLACMVQALQTAEITTLVDIRHAPCSSNLNPNSNYGPKDWTLQPEGSGVVDHLKCVGIEYIWLVELGNPQRNDENMTVLREHIDAEDEKWPVNRGLKILRELVQTKGKRCCLLCACDTYNGCHRKVIAETLHDRFFGSELEICDLS